ncbi:MAG: hypothetical protein J6N54_05835 [Bacteroidales bacterium]|nr:hypothetical protein [Bacteroidales bacterium]
MRNGIVIRGVEYEMHRTSDIRIDPCQRCDLKKTCGHNTLYGPCSLAFWSDNMRFTYFKKK